MAKFGCQCDCGKRFAREKLTRKQYANQKVEHAKECAKMFDWLKRSGKDLSAQFVRPAA